MTTVNSFDKLLRENYNLNMKNFNELDEGFVCSICGTRVPKLKYSSRDHCTNCLCSLHVDVNPGDRQNECHGILVPNEVQLNSKKGYVIGYKCSKCGQKHNNKAAADDKFSTLLSVMNGSYNIEKF